MLKASRLVVAVICCALLGACKSGVVQAPAAPDLGGASMRPPQELLRSVSFDDAAQVRYGNELTTEIASRSVGQDHTGGANSLSFFPSVGQSGGAPSNAAWAGYGFDLGGYDEEPLIKLNWKTAPSGGSTYLLLADWDANKWEIVATDPVNVELPSLGPYISAGGELALVVIVTGSTQYTLRWLAVGDVPGPSPARIDGIAPQSGVAGQEMQIVPVVSGTEPITYTWDFGGAGTPATSSDPQPVVELGVRGVYQASLTVSNKYGTDTFDFEIFAANYAVSHKLYGDAAHNRFVALDTTIGNQVFIGGEMNGTQVTVYKISSLGGFAWSKVLEGLPANRVADVDIIDDTQILLAAYQQEGVGPIGAAYIVSFDDSGTVQWCTPLGDGLPDVSGGSQGALFTLAQDNGTSKVGLLNAADGSVIWHKGTVDEDLYLNACVIGDGCYFAGNSGDAYAVARIGFDGVPNWLKKVGSGKCADVDYMTGLGPAVIGSWSIGNPEDRNSFFASFFSNGNLFRARLFATGKGVAKHINEGGGMFVTTTGEAPFLVDYDSRIYLLDPLGESNLTYKVLSSGSITGGECARTKEEPRSQGEYFVWCGAAENNDLSLIPLTIQPEQITPTPTDHVLSLGATTLPQEDVTVTATDITYENSTGAGKFDAAFLSLGTLPL
jgi:PKD repeat protein